MLANKKSNKGGNGGKKVAKEVKKLKKEEKKLKKAEKKKENKEVRWHFYFFDLFSVCSQNPSHTQSRAHRSRS